MSFIVLVDYSIIQTVSFSYLRNFVGIYLKLTQSKLSVAIWRVERSCLLIPNQSCLKFGHQKSRQVSILSCLSSKLLSYQPETSSDPVTFTARHSSLYRFVLLTLNESNRSDGIPSKLDALRRILRTSNTAQRYNFNLAALYSIFYETQQAGSKPNQTK